MSMKRGHYDNEKLALFLADMQREMGGLSNTDIAVMLGVTRRAVANWVDGYSVPGDRNCRRLADVLGVSENQIREMVGRPRKRGITAGMFHGINPLPDRATLPCPRSAPVEPMNVCQCGTRVARDVRQCEWCRQDWGYREYLRWCVMEGRVLSTPLRAYRNKAKAYFRLNKWLDA